MYWKEIASGAKGDTKALEANKLVPSVVTTLSTYWFQWKLGVRPSLSLTMICIGIGLATYALIILGEFTLKFFRTMGRDQDSKQEQIRRLLRLMHPELSGKAELSIAKLEQRIEEADKIFDGPLSNEVFKTWENITGALLLRTLGQGSDWCRRFIDIEPSDLPLAAPTQTLLLRRVSLLRDVIDEIKRQRVLVLSS
jgi:hypothetical protein